MKVIQLPIEFEGSKESTNSHPYYSIIPYARLANNRKKGLNGMPYYSPGGADEAGILHVPG